MKRYLISVLSAGSLALGTCAVARTYAQAPQPPSDKLRSSLQPVATGKQRIAPGQQAVAIRRGDESVRLDYFAELMIVRMNDKFDPEKLLGRTVLLVRETKGGDQWSVFSGLVVHDPLTLQENVFRVEKVLSSTSKEQVNVQVDGSFYHLNPGEVLLVLA